jgi:hypothetical protein
MTFSHKLWDLILQKRTDDWIFEWYIINSSRTLNEQLAIIKKILELCKSIDIWPCLDLTKKLSYGLRRGCVVNRSAQHLLDFTSLFPLSSISCPLRWAPPSPLSSIPFHVLSVEPHYRVFEIQSESQTGVGLFKFQISRNAIFTQCRSLAYYGIFVIFPAKW